MSTLCTLMICGLVGIILLIISLNDFLFYRIEDESIWILIGIYVLSCILGVSGHNFWSGFFIASGAFIVTLIMNRFGLIGGGDVKLLFPLILFAESYFYEFLVGVSVGGVILSLTYMLEGRRICNLRKKIIRKISNIKKNHSKNFFLNVVLLSLDRIDDMDATLTYSAKNIWQQEIPYGVALSCGAFCVMLEIWLSR